MFLPLGKEVSDTPVKTILMWNSFFSWGGVSQGRDEFLSQGCPVSSCLLVSDRTMASKADMILFNHYTRPTHVRHHSQIWMIYLLGENITNNNGMFGFSSGIQFPYKFLCSLISLYSNKH